ncbi:MAG: leucine-rich repeat domain-containing protein [Prevotella sp.]|nr:leucine-rich repeat domain-containing protein [Prevotella sp.]
MNEVTIGTGLHSASTYVFRGEKNISVVNYNATSVSVADGTGPLFGECTIQTFNIGANVTKMRSFTLWDCTVSELYSFNPEPPTLEVNAFQNSTIGVLYVPAGSEEAYATADDLDYTWDDIGNIKTFHLLDVFAKDKEEDEVGYGYATFYNGDYPYTMPEGLTGYSVVVDGNEANFNDTYNSNEVVPANTALLLYGQLCDDCIVYVKYDDDGNIDKDAGTAPTGNQLHGSFSDDVTADDMAASVNGDYLFYKFTFDTIDTDGFYTGMRFYWGAEDGGPFAIEAKRAWLAVPVADNEAKKEAFYLDDFGTTGIRSVDSVKPESDAIYNLQGIRVNDMSQKGIYIVGGKKVIKK